VVVGVLVAASGIALEESNDDSDVVVPVDAVELLGGVVDETPAVLSEVLAATAAVELLALTAAGFSNNLNNGLSLLVVGNLPGVFLLASSAAVELLEKVVDDVTGVVVGVLVAASGIALEESNDDSDVVVPVDAVELLGGVVDETPAVLSEVLAATAAVELLAVASACFFSNILNNGWSLLVVGNLPGVFLLASSAAVRPLGSFKIVANLFCLAIKFGLLTVFLLVTEAAVELLEKVVDDVTDVVVGVLVTVAAIELLEEVVYDIEA